MGEMLGVVCGSCNEEFGVQIGVGMFSAATRCDLCGAESYERHEWLKSDGTTEDDPPTTCECGGTFTVDGPFRCPHCTTTYSEEALQKLDVTMIGNWD